MGNTLFIICGFDRLNRPQQALLTTAYISTYRSPQSSCMSSKQHLQLPLLNHFSHICPPSNMFNASFAESKIMPSFIDPLCLYLPQRNAILLSSPYIAGLHCLHSYGCHRISKPISVVSSQPLSQVLLILLNSILPLFH